MKYRCLARLRHRSIPLVLSHIVHLLLRVATWVVASSHFLHLPFPKHLTYTFWHGLPFLLYLLLLLLLLIGCHLVPTGGTDVVAHPLLLLAAWHVTLVHTLRHLLLTVLLWHLHVSVIARGGAGGDRGFVVGQAVLRVAALALGP